MEHWSRILPERILLVHNRYQQPGGEDIAFGAEAALLEERGHVVERLEVSNSSIPKHPSVIDAAKLAVRTVWSRESAQKIAALTSSFGADIVHFHNTFPLLSPSVFGAARRAGASVVASAHNYRLICPSAVLFRDGGACTACVGRAVAWPGIQHACYRGSHAQTAVVTSMLALHRIRRTWSRDVDLFLTPSEATRAQLQRGGISADQIIAKPNFLMEDPLDGRSPKDRQSSEFLFVGRLTVEKGIPTLLEAWKRGAPGHLTIAGDGPLRQEVDQAASETATITALGAIEREDVFDRMRTASALIVPSIWEEPFGLIAIEAFACGLPVIAARAGALPEIVSEGQTGLLTKPADADDLVRALHQAVSDPEVFRAMGAAARQTFERQYTAEANYSSLMAAYERAQQVRAGGHPRNDAQE